MKNSINRLTAAMLSIIGLILVTPAYAESASNTEGLGPVAWTLIIVGGIIFLALVLWAKAEMEKKQIEDQLKDLLQYLNITVSDEVRQTLRDRVESYMRSKWEEERKWRGKFNAEERKIKEQMEQEEVSRGKKIKLEREQEQLLEEKYRVMEDIAEEQEKKWETLKQNILQEFQQKT